MLRRAKAALGNKTAKDELQQLDVMKTELLRRCTIPEELKCGISKKPLHAPIFFSPFGACRAFNKKEIALLLKKNAGKCPETGNPLSEKELVSDTEANRAITEFNKDHDAILAEIKSLSSRNMATSAAFQ